MTKVLVTPPLEAVTTDVLKIVLGWAEMVDVEAVVGGGVVEPGVVLVGG